MNRNLIIYVLFAAIVRLSFLVYTQAANPNPVWPGDIYYQLRAATRILDGKSGAPAYVEDGGLRYVLVLLSPLAGPPFLKLQFLQIFLDSLMVLAAWRIGMQLGGRSAARLAALLYAFFLPQAVLAVVPGYDVWSTWAFLVPVWLLLEALNGTSRWMAMCGILSGFTTALLSIVRSTAMFFVPVALLALLYFGRRRLSALVLAGWFIVTLPLAVSNNLIFGEARLVRGDMAHIFWAGIGQFPNAHGLDSSDQSVFALYNRLSGKTDYNSQESEAVLESAALTYIRDHPIECLVNVARRSVMIIFPRNYWGPWADQLHPRYKESLLLLARSPFEFVRDYPVTAILGVVGRIMDWLLLPTGMLLGILSLWKRPQVIALLPFLYTLVSLAPLYVTPRNTTNAYAAILPLCALGLVRLGQRIMFGKMVRARSLTRA